MRQFSNHVLSPAGVDEEWGILPIRQDSVCDFPPPCKPHMNIEKGMFVLWNILLSISDEESEDRFSVRRADPNRAYWSGLVECEALSTSAEKKVASLMSSLEANPAPPTSPWSDCKRKLWTSEIRKGRSRYFGVFSLSSDLSAKSLNSASPQCFSKNAAISSSGVTLKPGIKR